MTGSAPRESGRADVAALGLSILLGAAALAPGFLLRSHRGWTKCRDEGLAGPAAEGGDGSPAVAAAAADPIPRALAAADGARDQSAASAFRPDPSRSFRPLAGPAEAARCADLDGRVVDGRLSLRWRPAPGSRGTSIRIEGHGAPAAHEEEVPSDRSSLEIAVPGVAGTLFARAVPTGLPGAVAESRIAIPFRIPVDVVRAVRPDEPSGSVILVLRRHYDGNTVEAEFPLRVSDEVGSHASTEPDGPAVDFRTGFVLAEVRRIADRVPAFDDDGRVLRDSEGRPVLRTRPGDGSGAIEVVLRGPNDERKALRAE